MPDTSSATVLVPLRLEAFRLNPAVCGSLEETANPTRIIPITQPNYTFLRLDNFVIQSDVQAHADLHSTVPAAINSRVTNLATSVPRYNRHGIYLHWTLPRLYRSGVTSSEDVSKDRAEQERERLGRPSNTENGQGTTPSQTPDFAKPPTRWIVIRQLVMDSVMPDEARDMLPEYQAWVIESDNLWMLDEIPLDMDLQVDVSPFVLNVARDDHGTPVDIIKQQAEVFIGRKTPLEDWTSGPRSTVPDLTLLTSSNQLFADFQLHNSNVFSMLDNFQYNKNPKDPKYLSSATANYYLLGWHSEDGKHDPLNHPGTHSERISALMMALKQGGNATEAKDWLDGTELCRILCHGAMYDVEWDNSKKPPLVPADTFASRLCDRKVPAVSIGTTPMDALLTYCTARKPVKADSESIPTLEEDILAIDSLLHARDDGVEGQREAKDTVYNWNFDRSTGGRFFHLGENGQPDNPLEQDDQSKINLRYLNRCQTLLDACQRALKQLRWNLFALWWKYVSDVSYQISDPTMRGDSDRKFKEGPGGPDEIKIRIKDLLKRVQALETEKAKYVPATNDPAIDNPKLIKSVKAGTSPFFYRSRDPTILVGGIKAGWSADYLEKVQVRLQSQIVEADSKLPQALERISSRIQRSKVLDSYFVVSVGKLLSEFHTLWPGANRQTPPSQGQSYPQFHDNNVDTDDFASDETIRFRDRWGGKQPWSPLYAEWEVEYTHVPFDWWSLGAKAKRLSDNKLVRYGIREPVVNNGVKDDFVLYEKLPPLFREESDTCILSGRTLMLPQPSFSLKAKVEQLFSDTPGTILDHYLNESDRKALLAGIDTLAFLSAPLSGLTDGLTTLSQGTHIKPENKAVQDGREIVRVVESAVFRDAGLDAETLELIQGNSALTPYAAKMDFNRKLYHPFKPVTHGQFRFRRLNIIDKFGQAITALDPTASNKEPPPLWPCISDFYEPQRVRDSKDNANTVSKNVQGHCEYLQLPPQINQPVRLNAEFVVQTAWDKGEKPALSSYWRPTTEFDNPIWAWVVVNYADFGLQFFLPDGTFYREVRYGGPNGALTEPKWIPFAHVDDHAAVVDPNEKDQQKIEAAEAAAQALADRVAQLDALIEKLGTPSYLKSFWKMIITAQNNLPPPPDAYAQYLSSIVGKPFAMANMGWWLELETEPYQNQSTRTGTAPKPANLLDYEFQVKFGDVEREYDGLVGYFDVASEITDQNKNKELELKSFYTYSQRRKAKPVGPIASTTATTTPVTQEGTDTASEFDSISVTSQLDPNYPNLVPLSTANYPKFKPFYITPEPARGVDTIADQDSAEYESARHKKLQVYGAIFDPFVAIHAYSSILPARALKLPPWTWQAAMDNMTAFFHAGPITVVEDVKIYDHKRLLTPKNWREVPPSDVAIPSLGVGEWNWLQPYEDPATLDSSAEMDLSKAPVFNAYGIQKRENIAKPGFEKGPYTAIEGFLQLRNPIMKEKPGKNKPT